MHSKTRRITRALVVTTGCTGTFGVAAYLFAARGNGVLANLFLLLMFATGAAYFAYFAYIMLTSKK
jgi:hypothetical protein